MAQQLSRLEALLLRSADLEALDNPTRAALLQQAVGLSKEAQLSELLEKAAESLLSNQLSEAIDQQKASREALKRLLELLQSENREKRVREQRDQVRRWIEDADRLLRLQSSLRGRTEGGQDSQQAAKDQQQLADKASQIASDLNSSNASPNRSEAAPQTDQTQSSPSTEKQPTDSKSNPEQALDGQPSKDQQTDRQKSESQQSEGQQSEGQQSEGQQSGQSKGQEAEGQQPQPSQSPTERAGQQIQQAQQRMQEARQELEQSQRGGAIEKQREAEQNLREAIEQLEEILRQLREEEVKRSLETLETRLRRMLELQNKIFEETQRLHEIAGDQPDRQVFARAATLARDQQKVSAEGERALLLLKEEGSSAAFPEALIQVNSDSASVATRLESGDVSQVTLVVQEDIVQALEEMVEAISKLRKDNQQRSEQNQQQPGGGSMDPEMQPLIDKLAELRLIRTLQMRVNKRTQIISQMLADPSDPVGQAQAENLKLDLKELSRRQESIEQVTRNVAQGDS
ncbi:MAG TPA: hypothetical protein DCF63_11315 [Planctomycetaceae bacterium]|nr:hypothetical protein [Planctomycetaceae bacterium]